MTNRKTLQDKALLALRQAVKGVVESHRKSGRPLAVWEDGKVIRVLSKGVRKCGKRAG